MIWLFNHRCIQLSKQGPCSGLHSRAEVSGLRALGPDAPTPVQPWLSTVYSHLNSWKISKKEQNFTQHEKCMEFRFQCPQMRFLDMALLVQSRADHGDFGALMAGLQQRLLLTLIAFRCSLAHDKLQGFCFKAWQVLSATYIALFHSILLCWSIVDTQHYITFRYTTLWFIFCSLYTTISYYKIVAIIPLSYTIYPYLFYTKQLVSLISYPQPAPPASLSP